MRYFVANWKANKNLNQALQWFDIFLKQPLPNDRAKIIICPPYPLLLPIKEKIKNQNIFLGAQDISAFESGSYTGEVGAKTLKGIVDYAIIGHSERRKYFNERNHVLFQKVVNAKKHLIEPIFCLRSQKDQISEEVNIIAYEPIYAIGSGNNESVEKVLEMKKNFLLKNNSIFLYGGSVNNKNASSYLSSSEIDGFLVGTASLDPQDFYAIVRLA